MKHKITCAETSQPVVYLNMSLSAAHYENVINAITALMEGAGDYNIEECPY